MTKSCEESTVIDNKPVFWKKFFPFKFVGIHCAIYILIYLVPFIFLLGSSMIRRLRSGPFWIKVKRCVGVLKQYQEGCC